MSKETRKVYAYSFEADENDLKSLAGQMGETIFWTANLSRFQLGKGLPDGWADKGSVFGSIGEIRWQRTKGVFKLLIIRDEILNGRIPIDGDWQAEELQVCLQDLKEPRVNPQFDSYPHGESRGQMKVLAVRRNGMPVAMSPRELLLEEGV